MIGWVLVLWHVNLSQVILCQIRIFIFVYIFIIYCIVLFPLESLFFN